jgi:hypothetical protein
LAEEEQGKETKEPGLRWLGREAELSARKLCGDEFVVEEQAQKETDEQPLY